MIRVAGNRVGKPAADADMDALLRAELKRPAAVSGPGFWNHQTGTFRAGFDSREVHRSRELSGNERAVAVIRNSIAERIAVPDGTSARPDRRMNCEPDRPSLPAFDFGSLLAQIKAEFITP